MFAIGTEFAVYIDYEGKLFQIIVADYCFPRAAVVLFCFLFELVFWELQLGVVNIAVLVSTEIFYKHFGSIFFFWMSTAF